MYAVSKGDVRGIRALQKKTKKEAHGKSKAEVREEEGEEDGNGKRERIGGSKTFKKRKGEYDERATKRKK